MPENEIDPKGQDTSTATATAPDPADKGGTPEARAQVTEQRKPMSKDEFVGALAREMAGIVDTRTAEQVEKSRKELKAQMEQMRAEFNASLSRYDIPGVGDKEVEQFQFRNLINRMVTRREDVGQYEVDLCREAAKIIGKDMSVAVDSAGGFVVPTQVMASRIIPLLRPMVIAYELGAVDLDGLSGAPVEIPKETGDPTSYWLGENTAVTASDASLGQLELYPHLVAAMTKLSLRLVNLSNPAAEGIVTRAISKSLALKVDKAFFDGTGASGQPVGALQTAGIQSVTSFGSASADTAYNKLIDMRTALETANAMAPGVAWAIDPTTLGKLQKMVDLAAQPKERRLFGSTPIGTDLLGFKYRSSTQLPANTIMLADWSTAVIGRWGTLLLRTTDQAGDSFEKFQVWIQGAMEVDFGFTQPTAIVQATGVS